MSEKKLNTKFNVRILTSSDSEAFRALRLEAVQSFGEIFANYYRNMEARQDDFWRRFCTETEDQCLFGLFGENKLIGVVGVEKWDKDETGKAALWTYAYLKPEYRGRQLASALYRAREEWTKRHSRYERAVLSIQEESVRSIEIHERHGARYLYTEQMRWYDGPPAPWRWYEKRW